MNKLRLTFACWEYDRTRALADGTVRADGIELTYIACMYEMHATISRALRLEMDDRDEPVVET